MASMASTAAGLKYSSEESQAVTQFEKAFNKKFNTDGSAKKTAKKVTGEYQKISSPKAQSANALNGKGNKNYSLFVD